MRGIFEPTLCIFSPAGRTFTFRGVEIVTDNESVLVAEYTAMSDHRRKRVTVLKSAIVAYSVLAPAEELCDEGVPVPKDEFGAVVSGVAGFVTDAGGGSVELSVDRGTMNYPEIGSRVRVIVDG